MSGGTFSVSRKIWDHEAFRAETFTEREAWLWIVGSASWKPRAQRVGDYVVDVDRGEFGASVRYMAKRFDWTPAKVQRYLKKLEKLKMIVLKTDTGVTVVRVQNYDVFQLGAQASDTGAIQERYRSDTKENKDVRRKKKEEVSNTGQNDASFDAFWSVVPRKIAKGAARKAWAKAVKACPPQQLIDGMRRYAQQRQGQDPQYTVHPATWLNQERWQDEAPPSHADFHKQLDQHLQEAMNDIRGTNGIGRIGGEQLPKPLPAPDAPRRRERGAGDQGDSGGNQRAHLDVIRPRRFP